MHSFSPGTKLLEDVIFEPAEQVAIHLKTAEEAVKEARRQKDTATLSKALIILARLRFRLGQYAQVQSLADEVLTLTDPRAPERADAWQMLANCETEIGNLAQAESYYRMAADLARETGYHRARVAALHGMAASVYFLRGRFDLALQADTEARRIAAEQNQLDWQIYPLVSMAMIYQTTGQHQLALNTLKELNSLIKPGSLVYGYYLCLRTELALDMGELTSGHNFLIQARPIAEASGEPWLNCTLRLAMSRYYRLSGNGPNARAWADDALSVACHLNILYDQGKALIERGRAFWLCDNFIAAEADFRAASEILTKLDASFELTRALFLIAALLHEQGHPEAANAWLIAIRKINEGGYAFLLEQERALAFPMLSYYQTGQAAEFSRARNLLLERLHHVPPPPLHIQTLGRFKIQAGKYTVDHRDLRQRRAGELFALLILTSGHRLSSEQIIEALFPSKPLETAQNFLYHATSTLRHALEHDLPEKFPSRYLEVEKGQITLVLPAGSWIDLEVFEEHCRRGEWEAALNLYSGELLPEYRYADWSIAPRERLALLYQRALMGAAISRLSEDRYTDALEACLRLLELEPWHEEATLLGMRAYMALNNRAGARRLYLALEKRLREELGTEPYEELKALYRSLTSTDGSPSS